MSLILLSYNLRLDTTRDGPHAWPCRKNAVIKLLRKLQPDICGLQEALPHQLREVVRGLGCSWVGLARDDGWKSGEYNPILYQPQRLELVQTNTYWLSETPHIPGSLGWDAQLPRIVTWARLRERASGRELVVFNTHLEWEGEGARVESARRLPAQVAEIRRDAPAVLLGDFNTTEDAPPYRLITRPEDPALGLLDARYLSRTPHQGPTASTNDWQVLDAPETRIDYVFVTRKLDVLSHRLVDERTLPGNFPSDHLPLEVRLEFV